MIILYNPVNSPSKKPVLPMSLLALGALLEGKEDYRIIDGNLVADGLTSLREALRESGAGILGLTVMPGPQLSDAVPICKALKAEFPKLIIVWGGYFPSLHCDVVMKALYVDYVFRGHCEREFATFLLRFKRGEGISDLAGLAWRTEDGEIRLNPKPRLTDINEFPDFPYERVPMDRYMGNSFMGTRTVPHHSSYGCPFMCNFCAVVHQVSGRYSAQTAQRTTAVVERLVKRYGANAIVFFDNNFFVQEDRVAEFSERITPFGIGWWGYGRVDTMLNFDDATWSAMRDSGLKMVYMGAESGDDEMLHRMNKGGKQTADSVLAVAEKMGRFGIIPEMSFLVGNPPNAAEDADRTIRFIRRLKRINPATEIVLYMYSPVPVEGTLLDDAVAMGFHYPESLEAWTQAPWEEFAQHRSSKLPWLNARVRRKVRNFQRVLHAAYPTVTDPKLKGLRRSVLRSAAAWRYASEFYAFPIELRIVNRLFPHNRPEVTGF
jgi:pyruvate-formate lyase-activating enzyme